MEINIVLGVFAILLFIAFIAVNIKYRKLVNEKTITNKYISELNKPLRYGYISKPLTWNDTTKFTCRVYVKELDRFTNGESRIEIDKIESGITSGQISPTTVENFIRDQFISVVETSDVVWLESENAIKDVRRKKLEQLKENIEKK
jgi:hypothetical protein